MRPLSYSRDLPAVVTGMRDGTVHYGISTRDQNDQAVDFEMTKVLRLRFLKSYVPLSHQGNILARERFLDSPNSL